MTKDIKSALSFNTKMNYFSAALLNPQRRRPLMDGPCWENGLGSAVPMTRS